MIKNTKYDPSFLLFTPVLLPNQLADSVSISPSTLTAGWLEEHPWQQVPQ